MRFMSPRLPMRRLARRRRSAAAWAAVALLLGALSLCGAATASAQTAFVGTTIDGPNPAILSLGNVSLARDGTGAVIYLRSVAGVAHVFASTESGGVWRAPVQLDGALPGAASQPAIAVASGGRIVAVFISGGTLYAVVHDPGAAGFSTPAPLVAGASNPALAISNFGTAYTSFTAPNGAVSAVYVARLDRLSDQWQLLSQPLNLVPTDSAGFNAATRSAIAVASDGEALAAWGEMEADGLTHVIARRVSAAGVSTAPQDLNLAGVAGLPGGNADSPSVSLEDASDFGWVAFRQSFTQGAAQVSLTIARHQYGSLFDPPEPPASGFGDRGPTVIDALTLPTSDGADDPQVAIDGTGDGLASIETTVSHEVFADPLSDPYFSSPTRIDAATNAIPPQPVATVGGVDPLGAVAWLQAATAATPPAVYVRAYNGSTFTPQSVISAPALGAAETGPGALSAAADQRGDTFVAFLQGAPASTRVMIGGIAQAPESPVLLTPARTTQRKPLISWTAAYDELGIAGYTVDVDGIAIGTTTATHLTPTAALPFGTHTLQVIAVNRYGVRAASPTVTLVVAHAKGTTGTPGHP